jgi:ribosomal protein S18 acetylase RimI-like enzyme
LAWFFEDVEGRADRVSRMMAFSVEVGLGRGHVYTTQNRRAAAIWSPPDVAMLDEHMGLSFATLLQELIGSDAETRLTAFAKMEEMHPHESHFYLFSLGTHAEYQGQGLGAEVVAPVLEICDAQRLPVYLESSNPRNIPFYQRHGFELRGELLLAEGGPSLSTMWRDPR